MRIGFLLVCLIMVMGTLACGGDDTEAEKARALNAARQWVDGSTEAVVDAIVTLVVGRVPGANLLSSVIAGQIDDRVTWSYSEPVDTSDDNVYGVTATVSTEVEFDLPLLGPKTYEAKLPFDLHVDVDDGEVTRWSANLDGASVGEKR